MTENKEPKEMMNELKAKWQNPLTRAAAEVQERLTNKRDKLAYLEREFDSILDQALMEPEQLFDAIEVLRFEIREAEWVLGER